MLAIVTGGEPAQSTFQSQPKTAGKPSRSGKQFQNPGRRLVSSAPAGLVDKKDEPPKIKFTANSSIEDIDKILEDDALALLNIKKEINHVQEEELDKLYVSVQHTKKEYDNLFVTNNFKEQELKSYVDQYNALAGVEKATVNTQEVTKSVMDDLTDQTAQVLDDLAAEQRTIKMITLMIKRLDEEIGACRLDISKASINVEHAQHDLGISEHNLMLARQALLEQENQLEKLQSSLKSRKDQRDKKINMLQSMSIEGEQSVMRLQQSLFEGTKRSQTTGKLRKSAGVKTTTKSNRDGHEDDDVTNLNELEVRARRMNVPQIKEAIQRYQSQTSRTEKLQQLDQELRNNIISQQKKKQELSEHLAQTQFKIQQLASSRQIYQEVDLKDATLANTSKECDESKERDFRLRLNLEEVKQSVPRFLTKVTKVVHPKPNESQLGDAIIKLEEEVIKLIKLIGSALLKDATPDDLAMISQQNNASAANGAESTNSEFARLQRLPGFSRMQRQLFYNMMTARPDTTDMNVRIEHPKKPSQTAGGPDSSMMSPRAKKHIQSHSSMNSQDFNEMDIYTTAKHFLAGGEEEPSMGRDTIKNISKLIVEKDFLKVKAPTPAASGGGRKY